MGGVLSYQTVIPNAHPEHLPESIVRAMGGGTGNTAASSR